MHGMRQSERTRRGALTVAGAYVLLSAVWILFSDRVAATLVTDAQALTRLQTVKIWLFVALTAVALFILVRFILSRLLAEQKTPGDSHTRLHSVVDTVVDGIVTIDDRGAIESFNAAAQRIFGYREQEVLGRNVNMLMPEPYQGEHDGYLRDYLRSGEAKIIGIGREVVGLRRDGSTFPMELAVSEFAHGERRMFTGIVRDITRRKRAETALQANQARLRSLTSELSFAEERERRRVAVDLHDHIGQTLALAKIRLGALRQAAAQSEHAKTIDEIRDLVSRSIDSTRSLTFELGSPILYELGLVAALESLVDQAGRQHSLTTRFEDDGQPKPVSEDVAIVLFQAVRELLNNIAKHADAREAAVAVRSDGKAIDITVTDDGRGFHVPASGFSVSPSGGFGLFHVSERLDYMGGRFAVESAPGRGTTVQLSAPLSLTESPAS